MMFVKQFFITVDVANENESTVKPRYNGSKSNGNPSITDPRTWSLHVNFF